MVFCCIDKLKMSVKACYITGPKSFRYLYEMPSGLTTEVGYVCSIACLFMFDVRRRWGVVFGHCLRLTLTIFLSMGSCGSLEVDAYCLLSRCGCSLGEGIVLLYVSVYVLLRYRKSTKVWRDWFRMRWWWENVSMLSVVRVGYYHAFLCLMFVCGWWYPVRSAGVWGGSLRRIYN